jgi:uncharacterized protein (DUF2164 family)
VTDPHSFCRPNAALARYPAFRPAAGARRVVLGGVRQNFQLFPNVQNMILTGIPNINRIIVQNQCRSSAAIYGRSTSDAQRISSVMRKQPGITIPDDARKHGVTALREYVRDNLDEEIGDLKAMLFLDFIVSEIGPSIYNQAIADAQQYFEERTSDLAGACHHSEFPETMRRKKR